VDVLHKREHAWIFDPDLPVTEIPECLNSLNDAYSKGYVSYEEAYVIEQYASKCTETFANKLPGNPTDPKIISKLEMYKQILYIKLRKIDATKSYFTGLFVKNLWIEVEWDPYVLKTWGEQRCLMARDICSMKTWISMKKDEEKRKKIENPLYFKNIDQPVEWKHTECWETPSQSSQFPTYWTSTNSYSNILYPLECSIDYWMDVFAKNPKLYQMVLTKMAFEQMMFNQMLILNQPEINSDLLSF